MKPKSLHRFFAPVAAAFALAAAAACTPAMAQQAPPPSYDGPVNINALTADHPTPDQLAQRIIAPSIARARAEAQAKIAGAECENHPANDRACYATIAVTDGKAVADKAARNADDLENYQAQKQDDQRQQQIRAAQAEEDDSAQRQQEAEAQYWRTRGQVPARWIEAPKDHAENHAAATAPRAEANRHEEPELIPASYAPPAAHRHSAAPDGAAVTGYASTHAAHSGSAANSIHVTPAEAGLGGVAALAGLGALGMAAAGRRGSSSGPAAAFSAPAGGGSPGGSFSGMGSSAPFYPGAYGSPRGFGSGNIGRWLRDAVLPLIAGTGAGFLVRLFGMAAVAMLLPVGAPAIIATIAVGALAGGLSSFLKTALMGGNAGMIARAQKFWILKTFGLGAVFGGAGGFAGGLLGNAAHHVWDTVSSFRPSLPHIHVPGISGLHLPHIRMPGWHVAGMHARHALNRLTNPINSPPSPPAPAPAVPAPSVPPAFVPASAAASLSHGDAVATIDCLKEQSYYLINGPDCTQASAHKGALMIQRALDLAQQNGIGGRMVQELHADEAYLQYWGLDGVAKNTASALNHARLAGNAVNCFGPRLQAFAAAHPELG